MVKSIALILATLTAPIAHPLHTSYTEIVRDARTGTLTVSVRLFADDFGTMVDSLNAVSGGGGIEGVARSYFERSVSVIDNDNKRIPLAWCGIRTVEGLTWLCARNIARVPEGKLRIRNSLMFDRFADQISIVRWKGARETRTVVLTATSPIVTLD